MANPSETKKLLDIVTPIVATAQLVTIEEMGDIKAQGKTGRCVNPSSLFIDDLRATTSDGGVWFPGKGYRDPIDDATAAFWGPIGICTTR